MHVELIRALVRDVLKNPHKREWSLQGMGMLRAYLTSEVRLHIWDERFRVPNVSMIHDHPWDFVSTIVSGTIENIVYELDLDERGDGVAMTHQMGIIVCGPNPKERGAKHVVPVRLVRSRRSRSYPRLDRTNDVDACTSYRMFAEDIHESNPSRGAVTLCKRTFKSNTELAHVFWPIGTEWVSAEPRPATKDEVDAITKHAMEVFES